MLTFAGSPDFPLHPIPWRNLPQRFDGLGVSLAGAVLAFTIRTSPLLGVYPADHNANFRVRICRPSHLKERNICAA